jgi:hypothetical protein
VTEIVDGCTDTSEFPKPPWRERKERFLARLGEAPAAVQLVVMADKLSNVRSTIRDLRVFGERVWERFRGGEQGSLWFYRAVVEAVTPAEANLKALHQELADAVGELEQLSQRMRAPK